MKGIIVVLALLAYTQAAHFYWVAGSTSTNVTGLTGVASPTATYVSTLTTGTGGACTLGTEATGYQKFSINVTVPSFWYFTGLFSDQTETYAQLQIYDGAFVATTPCAANLLALVDNYRTDAPQLSYLLWLTPGIKDIVVTSSDADYNGYFAVHADSTKFQTVQNDNSPWVLQPYQSDTTCSSYTSYAVRYSWYIFTPPTTGAYDVFVWSYNATQINPYFYMIMYNTTVTYLGQGNQTNPVSPCTGQTGFMDSRDDDSTYTYISQSYYRTGSWDNVQLTNGINYTVVMTTYYTDDYQNFGVWWRPSVWRRMGTAENYYVPVIDTSSIGDYVELPCTGEDEPRYWNAETFITPYRTVLVGSGANDLSYATTCVYSGRNTGTKFTVAPTNCTGLLDCKSQWWDADIVAVSGLTPNVNYTVVTTTYYSTSDYSLEEYSLFVYSGVQLGPFPGGLSSGASTTDMGSGSDASVAVASALLVAALAFF